MADASYSLPLVRVTPDGRVALTADRIEATKYSLGHAVYVGLPADLMAAGLLRSDMIPAPGKQAIGHYGTQYPENDRWRTKRVGGGRIRVCWQKDPLALPEPPAPKKPAQPIHKATAEALLILAAKAARGEVDGIAYMVTYSASKTYDWGFTDFFAQNPRWGLGVLPELKRALRKQAKRKNE